ncbi:CoA pyrophosphatase [Brevundimonas lenta]|uniref:8-oxo-dGTP pyrophosphatase MutT (NUDIX family) n=1 Tax=Brevundimonas lenta TaxID=424796 RepID=A0A7W6JEX5_9CAUL|nr:CoA pyrophosphatase [Brevundimonas lenta]MBB4083801.1 8-oxo-dGTP pyrophosphatase MutT (NUDIX family) [Brevundimonas lenta]
MSLATLRERLAGHLIPIGEWSPDAVARRSDFDLNPDAERPERSLRAAAVLVPIIARADGATVLMTRRADTLASHTGQIAFPGGRLDPGETAVQAALREAFEEVALDPAAVEVLGLGDSYETGTGFLITPVIGWLAEPPSTTPAPDEVAEVFETPWDFLMDPANHRRDFYDREGQPRRWFWAMPWEERYIWGATAGILRGLRTRLYGDEAEPLAAAGEDAA